MHRGKFTEKDYQIEKIYSGSFYHLFRKIQSSRIDRKLCQDRRPVYREPGKMAPMESRENEPLSNW